ncbi:hypothetical protein P9X10_03080 [Bacillus cereus]|nr:hypothetical protein [Bacillus cereus]
MKRRLVALTIPVMLLGGVVGCSDKEREPSRDFKAEAKADKEEQSKKISENAKKQVEQTDSIKPVEEKPVETTKPVETPKVDSMETVHQNYMKEMRSLLATYVTESETMGKILLDNTKPYATKKSEYLSKADGIIDVATKIENVDPGTKFASVHETVKESMREMKSGVRMAKQGLSSDDSATMLEGVKHINKSNELMNKATGELKDSL